MLAGPLPTRVDHHKLASQHGTLEGTVAIRALSRFRDALADSSGEVLVQLAFQPLDDVAYDDEGLQRTGTRMEGTLETEVSLTCQSCLTTFRQTIKVPVRAEIFPDESMIDPGRDWDPLVLPEAQVSVADLIEDDLLLSIPMIARHPDGECPAEKAASVEAYDEADSEEGRHRPFAGLADALKQDKDLES